MLMQIFLHQGRAGRTLVKIFLRQGREGSTLMPNFLHLGKVGTILILIFPHQGKAGGMLMLIVPHQGKAGRTSMMIFGSEEINKTKKDAWLRFQQMDPSVSGREAVPIYRDKKTGERISKEELLRSPRRIDEKPKEIKLEWDEGLAQKREAETKLEELELEKEKPFARTRDDPELDKILKERTRWGDPMAHLVKDIPVHSWLKRGLDAAPNRHGIRPGRHWDGVDRSNGFEKGMFKRKNEKQATQAEAYLWSVADM